MTRTQNLYLWFVCLVAATGGLLFGYDAVVVSGTTTQVMSQFKFTAAQLGIYVSCVLWGCAAGSFFSGFFADAHGRKKILLSASVLIVVSAIFSALADSPIRLIFARLIGGVGIGMATMICPLYISEISPEQHRGRMVTLFQLSITIGIIMCVFMNWGIFSLAERNPDFIFDSVFKKLVVDETWRAMFAAEAIPGLLFMVLAFFLPESPRWLIKQNRNREATAILRKVNPEQRAIQISAEIEKAVKSEANVGFKDLFTAKLRRPLCLALLICFLSESSGVSVIFYYGPRLLEQVGFGLGESLGGFATIAIVNFFATLFALKYIDSTGRRKLLAIGTVGCIASHLAIGTLYLTGHRGILIVMAINAFVGFFACALGPIKFVIVSEIFPNRVRGQAVAISTLSIWIASATVAYLFPVMQEIMHTGAVFLSFIPVLVGLLFVIKFLMPETKGRTIEEIEMSWL